MSDHDDFDMEINEDMEGLRLFILAKTGAATPQDAVQLKILETLLHLQKDFKNLSAEIRWRLDRDEDRK